MDAHLGRETKLFRLASKAVAMSFEIACLLVPRRLLTSQHNVRNANCLRRRTALMNTADAEIANTDGFPCALVTAHMSLCTFHCDQCLGGNNRRGSDRCWRRVPRSMSKTEANGQEKLKLEQSALVASRMRERMIRFTMSSNFDLTRRQTTNRKPIHKTTIQ